MFQLWKYKVREYLKLLFTCLYLNQLMIKFKNSSKAAKRKICYPLFQLAWIFTINVWVHRRHLGFICLSDFTDIDRITTFSWFRGYKFPWTLLWIILAFDVTDYLSWMLCRVYNLLFYFMVTYRLSIKRETVIV